MHFTEKHCCKLYMGTLVYSPTLTLWFNQKILWSLVFKKLSGQMVISCHIQCLAHRSSSIHPLSVSTEVALHNYKAAQNKYQDLQPPSFECNSCNRNSCPWTSLMKTSRQSAASLLLSIQGNFLSYMEVKECTTHEQHVPNRGPWP